MWWSARESNPALAGASRPSAACPPGGPAPHSRCLAAAQPSVLGRGAADVGRQDELQLPDHALAPDPVALCEERGPLRPIAQQRIAVVQVDEADTTIGMREARDRLGHRRVRDLGQVAPGQLGPAVEGSIKECDVDLSQKAREILVSRFPAVDVGAVKEAPMWPGGQDGDGITELAAVRYGDRGKRECGRAREGRAGRERPQMEVAQRHQLRPGAVAAQKGGHRFGRVGRHATSAHHLAAEMDQAGVVADVGVGEDKPGQGRRGRVCGKQVELLWKVGGDVDDPARPSLLVDQGQAGHQPTSRRVGSGIGTGSAAAARLGHSAVLCAAK